MLFENCNLQKAKIKHRTLCSQWCSMICCLNPDCNQPHNPDGNQYCQQCGSPLSSLLRNRFEIIKLLGQGGFGKTYLAYDTDKLNEQCVVKQLTYQSNHGWMKQKAIQLFEGEAQQLQKLGTHPQIPALLAYFEEEGCLYLVQQLIEGKNLKQFLDHQGPFSEQQVRQILLDLLPVLQFIHERGVVHRDIKPDNIMHRPGSEKYILIDFGVAKSIRATTMDHAGTVLGSPGYAPFEQKHQGIATPSGDLFGLGASCFHLLSQTPPSSLLTEHGYGWLESWQDYVSQSLSPSLQHVLGRLLQKEAALRYQSAEAALQDLNAPSPHRTQAFSVPSSPKPHTTSLSSPISLQNKVEQPSPPTALVDSSFYRPTRFVFYLAPKEGSAALQHRARPRPNLKLKVEILLTLGLLVCIGYLLSLLIVGTPPSSQPTLYESNRQAEVHIEQGDKEFDQGNYQQALHEYKTALKIDPKNDVAHFNSGITKRRLNDLQGAITHYTTAIRLNPNFADAYNNRGLVQRQLGNTRAAISDFNEAIRVESQHARAYNNRGTTYFELGEKTVAVIDYTQAIRLDSRYAEAYFNRGIVQSELGNLKAAMADYTQALHIDPHHAQAYNNRGITQSELGNLKAAIADYTQAIRTSPQYPQAYTNRSSIKNQLGDIRGAIDDLQKAAEIYRQQGKTEAHQKIVDRIQKFQ